MSPRVIAIRPRLLATAFAAVALFANIHAATLVVTSTADDGSPGTLRAALAAAADGDVIDATGITGTIVLLPQFLTSSQLGVTKSVGIVGPGADKLTIDGNQTSRVFRIFPGLTVVIEGLTIANGRASGAPPGSFPQDHGGGIYNDHSSLTVRNCVVAGNSADEKGHGIYNDGTDSGSATLIVVNSTLSGNGVVLLGFGGGIFNDGSNFGSATVTVDHSRLSGNSAGSGGGIVNAADAGDATLTVIDSTISGNSAASSGGGISNAGFSGVATLTIVNSTISGNSAASSGGGIDNTCLGSTGRALLELASCTISGNSASGGGGIRHFAATGARATLEIGNTILRAGGSGANISSSALDVGSVASVDSLGFNLSSDDGGTFLTNVTDRINIDPMLGPLADNGGPTLTHLPLPGSPAIDSGASDGLAAFGITSDQRGLARTVDDLNIANAFLGDGTDIGAVEVAAAPPPPPPAPVADVAVSFLGADKVSVKQGEVLTYTIAVRNFGPNTALNVVVDSLLSSGTGFLNARATKGSFSTPPLNETGAVVWSLGDMANGGAEGAELIVSVLVKGKTTVTNLVTINSDADDPNAENNVASITTSVATGGSGGGGGGKKK